MARLRPDGRPAPSHGNGAMGPVLAMAWGGDGHLATGGWGSARLPPLVRVSADGCFRPGLADEAWQGAYVPALAWAPGGELLFGLERADAPGRLMLLGEQGGPVRSFGNGEAFTCDDPGARPTVRAVHCSGDGTMLVGGRFDARHAVRCPGLVRMDMDGLVDTTFNAGLDHGGTVVGIHPLDDGSIIVHAFIDAVRGRCFRLFRLHEDGSRDMGFTVDVPLEGEVACVSVAGDVLYIAEVVQEGDGGVHTRVRRCAPAGKGLPMLMTVEEGLVRAMVSTPDGALLLAVGAMEQGGRMVHGLVRIPV